MPNSLKWHLLIAVVVLSALVVAYNHRDQTPIDTSKVQWDAPPAIVDPYKDLTPAADYARQVYAPDSSQSDRMNQQAAVDDQARQLRNMQQEQQIAARRQQDQIEAMQRQQQEVDYQARREQISQQGNIYGVPAQPNRLGNQPNNDDDYQRVSPQQPTIIRNPNSMPNVTAIQVAPERVWDYSSGKYEWADKQADGSLRIRDGQ